MDVTVDYELCQSLGLCEALAPEVFAIDDDGVMRVSAAADGPDVQEAVAEAVAACPSFALRLGPLEDAGPA